MRAEPIKTGFFTLDNGGGRPLARIAAIGAVGEKPMVARFFTLGSMGKNSFAASGRGSFGTHSPFRGCAGTATTSPPPPLKGGEG